MGRELKLIQVYRCQKFLITSPLLIQAEGQWSKMATVVLHLATRAPDVNASTTICSK
jgi:hypothetical protein